MRFGFFDFPWICANSLRSCTGSVPDCRGVEIEDQKSGRGILRYNWAFLFWWSANSPGGVLGLVRLLTW
jgi:hypothetical protein